MTTLKQYEAEIERLERLETGEIPCDQYGTPCYESPAEMAAELLSQLAGEIRSIAWNVHVQRAAKELAGQAIASADRIARENGRIGGYASR